jgi:hypothetical protein
LCKKVIDCIAFNEGEACEIEEILPLPWENGMRFSSIVSNILTNCLTREAKREITDSISQKICSYDTSKINFIQNEQSFVGPLNYLRAYFTSDDSTPTYSSLLEMLTSNRDFNGITGENKGILFNDCGIEKIDSTASIPLGTEIIYSSDPEIFTPLSNPPTTPRTPEGDIPVNLKIIVSNVSWNEQFGNDCSYNVYLCAQEAIATSEDDHILYLYRNFSYFNESDYNVDFKEWAPSNFNEDPLVQINVTAIKYPKLSLNLSGRNADISHIAKAFIAGLREYFIFNSDYNRTVNFFCINSGLYPDWKTCYENNVSVLINDNVPWKLESTSSVIDTFSSLPDFKYIYYDSSKTSYNMDFDVELTFFVYTSNITKLNNTIIVSPVLVITPKIIPCVNHAQCSQACSSLCPADVYGCCFGCMLGQCQGGQCKCVDATTYCSSSPPYQVGSECTRAPCSSYTSDSDCTDAGCRWCPSYGGISNGCGDSIEGTLCDGTECFTTAQCTDPSSPLPTCTWVDLWWVCVCSGPFGIPYPCCCSSTNTCTVPASECY